MQLQNKSPKSSAALRKIMLLTIMVAIGLILFTFEMFLPQLLPGGRIGLSQIVTLWVLFAFGWKEALVVLLLRVFIGNLVLGTLFNPVFLLSFGGALVALIIMALIHSLSSSFSVVGISILGALFHNITQLGIAYFLFIGQRGIFFLLPYFIWVSLISGLVIGLAAWYLLSKFNL